MENLTREFEEMEISSRMFFQVDLMDYNLSSDEWLITDSIIRVYDDNNTVKELCMRYHSSKITVDNSLSANENLDNLYNLFVLELKKIF